ncbi:uncharacterized protein LOC131430451 [Malaya genurostris]|uniref:uncharacterized protein LOC131430451 n=1 Tax=Malaya genurostris TaxID=325434 RepID=UPI0026F3BD57|nr:uncharacterized protein LOC131430451 [Malaya genurostris]
MRNRLQYLIKKRNSASATDPDSEVYNQLERQITELSEQLDAVAGVETKADRKSGSSKVDGFCFPLRTMYEIEQLEEAVRSDIAIREQYVDYMTNRKPATMDVSNFFSYLFTDEALISYNYSGVNNIGEQKMPMRNYSIFTDCMVEAWSNQGMTHYLLEEKIKFVVKKLTARRRMKMFRMRKALK